MKRRTALDLYCSAGGVSWGLDQAGYDVTGVDKVPQPNYPFRFIQADAMEFPLDGYDLICASPPCQRKSRMSNCRPGLAETYPDLIAPTISRLKQHGGYWCVENVEGSGLPGQTDLNGDHGLMLCGTMFRLELYRHRYFQTSHPIPALNHPRHDKPASRAGHWKPGTIISVEGHCSPIAVAREAMGGVHWMNRDELAESIPPAYARYVGEEFKAYLTTGQAA